MSNVDRERDSAMRTEYSPMLNKKVFVTLKCGVYTNCLKCCIICKLCQVKLSS